MQQGFLTAGEQRESSHHNGAVICGRKKAGQGKAVFADGKGVQSRCRPAACLQRGNIGLADAPQSAQQGSRRAGDFLLHMTEIHSSHALAQHFFQQV